MDLSNIYGLLDKQAELIEEKNKQVAAIITRKFKLTWKNSLASFLAVSLIFLTFFFELPIVVDFLFTVMFVHSIVHGVLLLTSSYFKKKSLLLSEEQANKINQLEGSKEANIRAIRNITDNYSQKEKKLFAKFSLFTGILCIILIFILFNVLVHLESSELVVQGVGYVLFFIIGLFTTEQIIKAVEQFLYLREVRKKMNILDLDVMKQFKDQPPSL